MSIPLAAFSQSTTLLNYWGSRSNRRSVEEMIRRSRPVAPESTRGRALAVLVLGGTEP